MTHTALFRSVAAAAVLIGAPLAAQDAPPRPAPPVRAAAATQPLLVPAGRQPRPRPASANASRSAAQPATPAVVLPATAVGTMDSTAVAAAMSPSAAVTPAVTPVPLARPVPPAPSALAAARQLPLTNLPGPAPVGATGRCKDGTYLTTTASDAQCSAHGGLGAIFEAPRAAPARPVVRQ